MTSMKKRCTKCGVNKLLWFFDLRPKRPCGYVSCCKECTSSRFKIYWEKNKHRFVQKKKLYRRKHIDRYREQHLVRKFGLTLHDYYKMLAIQKGVCGICSLPPSSKKNLGVDHNHKTGKVRGLLCDACNSGLGKFKDTVKLLKNVLIYLK